MKPSCTPAIIWAGKVLKTYPDFIMDMKKGHHFSFIMLARCYMQAAWETYMYIPHKSHYFPCNPRRWTETEWGHNKDVESKPLKDKNYLYHGWWCPGSPMSPDPDCPSSAMIFAQWDWQIIDSLSWSVQDIFKSWQLCWLTKWSHKHKGFGTRASATGILSYS